MSTFVLLEIADDGSVSAMKLTDPVSVTETVQVPLASLFPAPAPAPSSAEAPAPDAPPAESVPASQTGF